MIKLSIEDIKMPAAYGISNMSSYDEWTETRGSETQALIYINKKYDELFSDMKLNLWPHNDGKNNYIKLNFNEDGIEIFSNIALGFNIYFHSNDDKSIFKGTINIAAMDENIIYVEKIFTGDTHYEVDLLCKIFSERAKLPYLK